MPRVSYTDGLRFAIRLLNSLNRDLRCLFSRIIQQVETRFPNSAQSGSEYLPLQSITSLCFLRFFVPAIMNPGMFGLVHGEYRCYNMLLPDVCMLIDSPRFTAPFC